MKTPNKDDEEREPMPFNEALKKVWAAKPKAKPAKKAAAKKSGKLGAQDD